MSGQDGVVPAAQRDPERDAAPASRTRIGRRRSARWNETAPPELTAAVLRERIYGDIACLSTLLVLTQHLEGNSPWAAVIDVLIATGGLWGASLFAEFVAHLGLHGTAPRGRELVGVLRTSGQILEAAGLPLVLLVTAAFGWWSFHGAVWTSVWLLVASLGVFALLAARRTALSWWARGVLAVALTGLGFVVVVVKMLAH